LHNLGSHFLETLCQKHSADKPYISMYSAICATAFTPLSPARKLSGNQLSM
jgi:hypothetical protein